jgi:hypothetical protein
MGMIVEIRARRVKVARGVTKSGSGDVQVATIFGHGR